VIEHAVAFLARPVPLWALVVVAVAVWFVLRDTDRDSRAAWFWRSYDEHTEKGGAR
jgi:hypothetical protein